MFAQNIDCGYMLELPQRGSSNEYPQSIFGTKNKKIGILCKPQFCYIKVGYEGVNFSLTSFPDVFKLDLKYNIMSCDTQKKVFWVLTMSDTNQTVYSQKKTRSLKFGIKKEEIVLSM